MSKTAGPDLLKYYGNRMNEMLESTKRLVEIDSPSTDIDSLDKCAVALESYVLGSTGQQAIWMRGPETNRPILRFDYGDRTDVLLIGHFDTVYPNGTVAKHPFRIEGDRAYGPGVLDMKSGLVIMTEVVRCLQQEIHRPNVTLVFNSDEEMASVESGPIMRKAAADAKLVIAVEFTDPAGIVKIGNRGNRRYVITVHGKGGHAAYPEVNKNPVDVLADVIVQARHAHHPEKGRVVVPTIIQGSDRVNVVPDVASVTFDVRASTDHDFDEIDKMMRRISVDDTGFDTKVEMVNAIPPHPADYEGYPISVAERATDAIGMNLHAVEARGASDANQVSPVNRNVLEAVGAGGDGAHSPDREHILISTLPRQAALATLMTQYALVDAGRAEGTARIEAVS